MGAKTDLKLHINQNRLKSLTDTFGGILTAGQLKGVWEAALGMAYVAQKAAIPEHENTVTDFIPHLEKSLNSIDELYTQKRNATKGGIKYAVASFCGGAVAGLASSNISLAGLSVMTLSFGAISVIDFRDTHKLAKQLENAREIYRANKSTDPVLQECDEALDHLMDHYPY